LKRQLPYLQTHRAKPGKSAANQNRLPSTSLLPAADTPNTVRIKAIMSFYFAIIGTQDNPIFEHEFGTSKQGGDGVAKFPDQARHMNQFIVHSSLDIVEEVQWGNGQM
jgi:hypothetical protein